MEDSYKELRDKIAKGVEQAAIDLIKERQKNDSYLVVTDDKGNVIRTLTLMPSYHPGAVEEGSIAYSAAYKGMFVIHDSSL